MIRNIVIVWEETSTLWINDAWAQKLRELAIRRIENPRVIRSSLTGGVTELR